MTPLLTARDVAARLRVHLAHAYRVMRLAGATRIGKMVRIEAQGAAPGTISKELVTLRGILKVARRRGEYHLDPSAVLPVGFASCYIPRKRHVSPEELDALLADLEAGKNCGVTTGAQRAAAVAFMAATGARLGEVARARREDIDLGAGFVRIRGTKTAKAERSVPVVTQLGQQLLERALRDGGEDLLFASWAHPNTALAKACTRLKIPRVTPNDLRRTCATWLDQAGASHESIARVLGHSGTQMVARVYGQATPHDLARTLRALAEQTGSESVPFLFRARPQIGETGNVCETETGQNRRETVGSVGNDPTTKGLKGRCTCVKSSAFCPVPLRGAPFLFRLRKGSRSKTGRLLEAGIRAAMAQDRDTVEGVLMNLAGICGG